MNQYPPPYSQSPQDPQRQLRQPPQSFPPQSQFPPSMGVPPYTQYPNYQPQPGQYLYPPPQQGQPPKKKRGPWFWILMAVGVLVVFSLCIGISQSAQQSGSASNPSVSATDTPAPTTTPTHTPAPTHTPVPTLSPAQVEKAYKATTTSITVDSLDKGGNTYKGKEVHFTCKILKFVKDDSGNTAGANVDAPVSYSTSVIQIAFPPGTDITKLNEGDIVEVWGTDQGVFSGQNAFGGTVQEVGIAARYMTDSTTHYQAP